MESVAGLIRKLQLLLHRQRFNRELEEELAFHREQVEQEMLDGGMTAEDAHYAARRRLGNDTRLKEEAHDVIGFTPTSNFPRSMPKPVDPSISARCQAKSPKDRPPGSGRKSY